MAINPNKQKLDELLGIVSEMQKADPNEFGNLINGITAENPIPDDIPEVVVAENKTLTPQQPIVQNTADTQITTSPNSLERLDETESIQTQKSLSEIDSLIVVAKNVINHVYSVVTSSDILDAQTISAAANLIKETRALVQEHLEIQKSQRDFLNKIQMEEIKHQHQIQLMEKKFELERLRFQTKNPPAANQNVPNSQPNQSNNGLKSYSSADMMRMLNEED